MEADRIRILLLEQHARIRRHLERCLHLVSALDGDAGRVRLEDEVRKLHAELTQHNAVETGLVRSMLLRTANWGAALVDRMVEEHTAEHVAFTHWLTEPLDPTASRLPDLLDELEAHMAAEERTFLAPTVLHGDAIECRAGRQRDSDV